MAEKNEENKSQWFPFQDEIQDLINMISDEWPDLSPLNNTGFVPHIDVLDRGERILVLAEIPGIKEGDIRLSLEGNELVLEGDKKPLFNGDSEDSYYKSEISYGHFFRTIPFEVSVDEESIEATCRDGVLKVWLTKREKENKKIEVHPKVD